MFNPGLELSGFRTTRPRTWEKKERKYANNLAKIRVTTIFVKQDTRINVLPVIEFIKISMERPC